MTVSLLRQYLRYTHNVYTRADVRIIVRTFGLSCRCVGVETLETNINANTIDSFNEFKGEIKKKNQFNKNFKI